MRTLVRAVALSLLACFWSLPASAAGPVSFHSTGSGRPIIFIVMLDDPAWLATAIAEFAGR